MWGEIERVRCPWIDDCSRWCTWRKQREIATTTTSPIHRRIRPPVSSPMKQPTQSSSLERSQLILLGCQMWLFLSIESAVLCWPRWEEHHSFHRAQLPNYHLKLKKIFLSSWCYSILLFEPVSLSFRATIGVSNSTDSSDSLGGSAACGFWSTVGNGSAAHASSR